MNRFVLFGCGEIGKKVIEILGRDAVYCFADNTPTSKKREFATSYGKDLLDFDSYIKISSQYVTILSMSKNHAKAVSKQFQDIGIFNFIRWDEVPLLLYDNNLEGKEKMLSSFLIKHHNLVRDPHSQVEFYLVDSFEINHFLPIYNAMKRAGIKARFVAEPCWLNTACDWFDYDHTVSLLKEKNVKFSTLSNPNACVSFTTQYPRNLSRYCNKKALMFYGVNFFKEKVFSLKADVASGFNVIFTHGKFDVEKITSVLENHQVVDMSYPRYEEYFKMPPIKECVLSELRIRTKKPILLYCPTWDQYSSIPMFMNVIDGLRKRFYVVSKSHHCTYRIDDKKKDIELLRKYSDMVLPGTYDLGKAAVLADVAVCDATSGVFAELMFLRPELKLMAICPPNSKNKFFVDISQLANTVSLPDEAASVLLKTWEHDEYEHVRVRKISEYFSSDIHEGIQRVIQKISDFLE